VELDNKLKREIALKIKQRKKREKASVRERSSGKRKGKLIIHRQNEDAQDI
jgi:hypothetical protein